MFIHSFIQLVCIKCPDRRYLINNVGQGQLYPCFQGAYFKMGRQKVSIHEWKNKIPFKREYARNAVRQEVVREASLRRTLALSQELNDHESLV